MDTLHTATVPAATPHAHAQPAAHALDAQGLRKRYGSREVVAGVSLRVAPGEILGLLGPNGAGKSTTLAMVSGLTPPDAGTVQIAGHALAGDEAACKRRLGLVPQELALVDDLSARRNLGLFGALYGLTGADLRRRADTVLAQVGLADRADDKPGTFSGGMKRRLHIACALMHDPALLLLDEPTAGVDPQSRNAIFDTLLALKAAGKALVYTTHYMEEVERLADRIVIMDHGRVIAEGTLASLVQRLPSTQTLTLQLSGRPDAAALAALAALPGVRQVDVPPAGPSEPDAGPEPTRDAAGDAATPTRLRVALDDVQRQAAGVLAWLAAQPPDRVRLQHLASDRAHLEDVFLALTGRALRD